MPDTIVEAFYLGVRADLDPTESNSRTENAADLVGTTFGSSAAPLVDNNLVSLTLVDSNSNGQISDNDLGNSPAGEGLRYDGVLQTLDSTTAYNITITYTNGSTAQTYIGLVQDVSGRMFFVPDVAGSAGNDPLNDAPIRSIRIDSVLQDTFSGLNTAAEPDAFVACFAAGSRLMTPQGVVPVEHLRAGDLVLTRDHGARPVRWVRRSRHSAQGARRPIRIRAGALGEGCPERDLLVSRQHRILVRSQLVMSATGCAEVLVPAIRLAGLPGVAVEKGMTSVCYFHILFDRHEIVVAEGCETESFLIGPVAAASIGRRLPVTTPMEPARPIPSGRVCRKLIGQHRRSGDPLWVPDPEQDQAQSV